MRIIAYDYRNYFVGYKKKKEKKRRTKITRLQISMNVVFILILETKKWKQYTPQS